ncbi:hypothetical protein FHS15_002252 [Paenibacillus castaneae]|nr:hypothetical protein [Paenibacillus castaneae]
MFKMKKWKLVFLAAILIVSGGLIASLYDAAQSDASGVTDSAPAELAVEPIVPDASDISLEPARPDRQDELSFFRSNEYTKPETANQAEVPAVEIGAGFERIGQNDRMALYMNMETFAIQVQDRTSGYIWSSVPSESDFQAEELNEDWKNAMQSPFLVDYFGEDAFRTSSNYMSLQGKAASVNAIDNGLEVTYELPDLQVTMTMQVALEEDGLVVKLLNDSIQENGPSRIASVQLYPFLGAVRDAAVPGYLFIPDGSGALIRFTNNHTSFDEPYVGQIYYNDIGIGGFEGAYNKVGYPVFGVVHGVKKNALMGVVEDGKMNAEIVAYPSGVNTNFNWVSTRFNIRTSYYQPTSKTMGGINMYTKTKLEGDKQIRYRLLSGEQADYVGMAQDYRSYLQSHDMLPKEKNGNTHSGEIPLRIDMLGSEMTTGIFKRGVMKMTSFNEAELILQDLKKSGIDNIRAGLQGWSKGGATAAQPAAPNFEKVLGGSKGMKSLLEYAKNENIDLYLNTDYTNMLGGSPRVEPRVDSVRMITNRLIEYKYVSRYVSDLFRDIKAYMLSPDKALSLATEDFRTFNKEGIQSVAINGTGYLLYSDYNKKKTINRTQAADIYGNLSEEAAKQSIGLSWYQPNDYMLKHTAAYFDMPLNSSQFMYATDTVPFLPMVLHGVMDYYAEYGNNNADPELDLLRMIEYGAYPSYLVTKEPSWKLQNTPSGYLYTTEYKDWAPQIKKQYAKANEALKQVKDAVMTGRTIMNFGIIKVSYDNGVDIWVNYTSENYSQGSISVKARDVTVTGGNRS